MNVLWGVLLHELFPTGPSGGAVVIVLLAAGLAGALYSARAVRVRRSRGGPALARFAAASAALAAIAIALLAWAGGAGEPAVALWQWLTLWLPAASGITAASIAVHRRARRPAGNDVMFASVVFVFGAVGVLSIPLIAFMVALALA